MDPLLQPIETYKLPIAFKAADILLPSNQDWIFEMEKEVVSSVFIIEYQNLMMQLASEQFSRVLVVPANYLDAFPEDCHVVPTHGEAKDLIEMERIQRDLGF